MSGMGAEAGPPRSRCGLCGRMQDRLALWCERCLIPYIVKGLAFRASITVRRSPLAARAELAKVLVTSGAKVVLA